MNRFVLTFRAFKYRNFRLFFPGLAVSQIGIWIQNIAISWLVYDITKSPLAMGSVLAVNTIPLLVLTPFSGVIADKFNRKKLLFTVQVLYTFQAFCMSVLTLFGWVRIWNIMVCGVFLNMVAALDTPLRQSTFAFLVDNKDDLNNAISLNSSCFNLAKLVGPAIGGILIAYTDISVCFVANFLCLIPSIFLISKMNIVDQKSEHVKNETILEGLKEGIVYVASHPKIYVLQIFILVFSYLAMCYPILLPIYTKELLQGKAQILGYLMSAVGVGALVSSLLLASRSNQSGLKYVLTVACSLTCLCMVFTGVIANFYVDLVLMFFMGLGMTGCVTPQNSLVQDVVDDEMRGRVMSVNTICFLGTTSLSSFTVGTIAEFFGIRYTFIILGITLLILNVILSRIFLKFKYND